MAEAPSVEESPCPAGGCAGETGWGSQADSCARGPHAGLLGRLQGLRGQAGAVPSLAVTLPPGEGALWALGWEDVP